MLLIFIQSAMAFKVLLYRWSSLFSRLSTSPAQALQIESDISLQRSLYRISWCELLMLFTFSKSRWSGIRKMNSKVRNREYSCAFGSSIKARIASACCNFTNPTWPLGPFPTRAVWKLLLETRLGNVTCLDRPFSCWTESLSTFFGWKKLSIDLSDKNLNLDRFNRPVTG